MERMERGIARSFGTCMTMGTASTMTALADTLGLSLPAPPPSPAADAAMREWLRFPARASSRWSSRT